MLSKLVSTLWRLEGRESFIRPLCRAVIVVLLCPASIFAQSPKSTPLTDPASLTRIEERIAGLRTEAAEKGYNPNLWFNNVETIAAARIGQETVTYVANINKYYMAYTDFYTDNLKRQLQIRSRESAPKK